MLRFWPLPLALALTLLPEAAHADRPAGTCIDVAAHFTPSPHLQIVAWIEKADGTYVDTIYMTAKTGRYGLGNRPGRFDFNSGPPQADNWPYGRRITTFPIWAHEKVLPGGGQTFPEVVFQNGEDDNLSHPFDQSSPEMEPPYCRPMQPTEPNWDTGTCASQAYTDKGTLSATATSLYPPRVDITRNVKDDSPSVDLYKTLNPYDAITQATPPGGQPTTINWAPPQSLALGDYVLKVEVSKEYDMNSTYCSGSPDDTPPPQCANPVPPPQNIPWSDYGQPYRGQPSVLYSVPFTLGTTAMHASTDTYAGYGAPDGGDGTVRPPDSTITTDTPGSGGSRLELVADGSDMYRLLVDVNPEADAAPPSAPARLVTSSINGASATVSFVAPGDDGTAGTASGYDIRIRAGSVMTADNFDDSMPVTVSLAPTTAGSTQTFQIDGLLPETDYWVGVRAYDNCFNKGPVTITKFTTSARQSGEVNACFIATAAYGSLMANEVEHLRRFRDVMLERNVLGELAVETYYTFGPAVAGVVGESELLRATARDALAPIVGFVRHMAF